MTKMVFAVDVNAGRSENDDARETTLLLSCLVNNA